MDSNKVINYSKLAADIISYCKKWGMWKDTSIFTGGKCYTYDEGSVAMGLTEVREEACGNADVEKRTSGYVGQDCEGNPIMESYSNPEHLLDMTFEGPLYMLLNNMEYEVDLADVSDEAIAYLKKNFRQDFYERLGRLCELEMFTEEELKDIEIADGNFFYWQAMDCGMKWVFTGA